jgi:hypothetical protein
MTIKEYKTYSWSEIKEMNITKTELAKRIGIECTYDKALPQEWLNKFVDTHGLDYHRVIFSTFMVYDERDYWGTPHSAVTEIQQAINKDKIEWIADTLADEHAQAIWSDLNRLTGVDIGQGTGELSRVLMKTLAYEIKDK